MTPQLTLQTPLQLPPEEIPNYLNKLWSEDQPGNKGANTFSLLIWQPAWIEQQLVDKQIIEGPIIGNQRIELVEAARRVVLEENLPHSTTPFDKSVLSSLKKRKEGQQEVKKEEGDLRGQHIDGAISQLQPRRLITLAPTIGNDQPLETLVAAYCPLPEEGGGDSACGDVIVLRGGKDSLKNGLEIVAKLIPGDLPSWIWWNGNLDEDPKLFKAIAMDDRRIIIDSALGDPQNCLELLQKRVLTGQAVNDLNWLRLRNWRETLAMVFDPPNRRDILKNIVNVDIDIESNHPVQGLLLAAWIADRLNWKLENKNVSIEGDIISAFFIRSDKEKVHLRLMPLPFGKPSIHPGQIVGLRLISKIKSNPELSACVILASESGECMRLEAGGMANMELLEEVVPKQINSVEMDVARLLETSRGSTSPLLANAAPIASRLLSLIKV